MTMRMSPKFIMLGACMVALAMLGAVQAVTPATKINCGDAVNSLIPCGSYLIGVGPPDPSPQCCASAKALDKLAGTVAQRRALCECLKQSGPSFGVIPKRAQHLPPFCKLMLNIPVSPTVNCNTIS